MTVLSDFSPNWTWEDPESVEVSSIAMNPSGTVMAVGSRIEYFSESEHSVIAVFDWRSPWPIFQHEYPEGDVGPVDISDDGQYVACLVHRTIHVFSVSEGLLWTYPSDWSFTRLDFDSNNTYLLAAKYGNPPFHRHESAPRSSRCRIVGVEQRPLL